MEIKQERQECNICHKFVYQMKNHLACHFQARFICEVCEKPFIKYSYYIDHVILHTNVNLYKCLICPNSYGKKWSLTKHMKCHENHRDNNGTYLPIKPRGRNYSNIKFNDLLSDSEIEIEKLSKGVDTSDLNLNVSFSHSISIFANSDSKNEAKPNLLKMTGVKWNNVLFSSKSCDTSDIDYFINFLKQISV